MERSDVSIRAINMMTSDGFTRIPLVYQELIQELEQALTNARELADTNEKVAIRLAQQSTMAHEALDGLNIPVCGLGIGGRMGCVVKTLRDKDKELESCRTVLNRLAHETKAKLRDQ